MDLLKDLGKRIIGFIFPEFGNKVTWTVLGTGIAVILLPTPVYIVVTNFIIDFYNKHFDSQHQLKEINDLSPSYWVGILLVAFALIYNISYNYMKTISNNNPFKVRFAEDKLAADRIIYNKLIEYLPPDCAGIQLLKSHDFGSSYSDTSISQLIDFSETWPEKAYSFHNSKIECEMIKLVELISDFTYKQSMCSYSNYYGSSYSMIPDCERGNWEYSEDTNNKIKNANKSSYECYEQYITVLNKCKELLAT